MPPGSHLGPAIIINTPSKYGKLAMRCILALSGFTHLCFLRLLESSVLERMHIATLMLLQWAAWADSWALPGKLLTALYLG